MHSKALREASTRSLSTAYNREDQMQEHPLCVCLSVGLVGDVAVCLFDYLTNGLGRRCMLSTRLPFIGKYRIAPEMATSGVQGRGQMAGQGNKFQFNGVHIDRSGNVPPISSLAGVNGAL